MPLLTGDFTRRGKMRAQARLSVPAWNVLICPE